MRFQNSHANKDWQQMRVREPCKQLIVWQTSISTSLMVIIQRRKDRLEEESIMRADCKISSKLSRSTKTNPRRRVPLLRRV